MQVYCAGFLSPLTHNFFECRWIFFMAWTTTFAPHRILCLFLMNADRYFAWRELLLCPAVFFWIPSYIFHGLSYFVPRSIFFTHWFIIIMNAAIYFSWHELLFWLHFDLRSIFFWSRSMFFWSWSIFFLVTDIYFSGYVSLARILVYKAKR